tara:strand:+ start:13279 stop:15615 length:2337 start_codon:yes stop_codon:yes gene_type:complete
MTNFLRHCLGLLAITVWLAGAAFAQEAGLPDFERWNTLAKSAENAVDTGADSDEVLDILRKRMVEYRQEFDAARSMNDGRIAILREQLAALGPLPDGEGAEPEAPDVAAKREELTRQLNGFLAPVQRAEAEFLRANGLIGQIDKMIRDRQTEKLLTVTPTPLNPAHWWPAIADFRAAASAIWVENQPGDGADIWPRLRENLPAVLLLTAFGLVLILRGRRWSANIVQRLQRFGARGFGIWRFAVSLLRIILPTIGLVLLSMAVLATDLVGPLGTSVVLLIPVLGGAMLGFRWVAERVFSRDDDEALILLPEAERKRVRFYVSVITVTIVLGVLISTILDAGNPAAATEAVLRLPVMLLTAFSLFNIGRVLRGFVDPRDESDSAAEVRVSTLSRFVNGLGLGAIVVSVLAPLLLISGYFSAADALLPPYVSTLVLLGLVMVLQRFSADVYGAITGQGVQAREALMPVLFGLVLILMALPVGALAWGARVTDLTELWALFSRGFAVGDSRISPTDFLTFAIIFIIGYAVTRLVQGALRSNVLPKTRMDIGGQNAIVSGLGYVGIFLAALLAITGAGINLSALAYVAGALSVGIGFGLQNVVSNFVSGIILLIERPISEGDWIEVGGQMGYVRDISVRSTRIETFDRTDVIVPNADLISGTVTNYTRGNTVGRLIVTVGVAYGTDTKRVEALLREIAQAQPIVLTNPPPNVLFVNFGADALEFEVRCYLRDINWMMVVKNDINHAIAAKFKEEGIEIPFAQRDLWLRNPEALRSTPTEPSE